MKKDKIKFMCLAGVFTALVFVVTAYLHIPTNNGYIHVGDGIIYLAACLLPFPYGLAVGAGGALLADCLTGFAIWAPASVIIKALTALLFSSKTEKIMNLRNSLVLFPAAILCAGGYYLYEALLYGNFVAPLAGIPASITQSIASSIVFVIAGVAMDKMNVKSKLNGGKHL
ncbi:MAG: TIGR04002 family protein [Ruminococcus sp.]|nr:TIGR04002 family protein [Ruminococcus sp.]